MTAPPLGRDEFAAMMAGLGPFEPRPKLAVATSGGPDSLALTLLAAAWGRRRCARLTALTVDHGLRTESAAEARRTSAWLAAREIDHRVLRWRGPKPETGLQAAARQARYRLLVGWCRRHGVRHLLLGHQLEDQAETLLMRLVHGSGLDGLAAMAPASEIDRIRLLRPLLAVPKARLRSTLRTAGQEWIEDPSNLDPVFARTQAGRALALIEPGERIPGRLARVAERLGRARDALESATTELLAAQATLDPGGLAVVTAAPFLAAPEEFGIRALSRLLSCVSGAETAPRLERLEQLYRHLRADGPGPGRTLHGCRVVRRGDTIVICREVGRVPPPVAVRSGGPVTWDGRFVLRLRTRRGARLPDGISFGALGAEGWRQLAQAAPEMRRTGLPAAAARSLPALWRRGAVLAAPHVRYLDLAACRWLAALTVEFRPLRPLGIDSDVPAIRLKPPSE